jgi:RimJ/RimL family protein N-acetyltransferase
MAFQFLQTGPLVDAELELVEPGIRWVDALLVACAHPASADDLGASTTTRARIMDFLRIAPDGHQPADTNVGHAPCYHFWMKLNRMTRWQAQGRPLPTWGEDVPPVEIAGGISLRVGVNFELEMYAGHFGYNVYPPARGNHYAERSCRLLLGLARTHGLKRIWITCNPDNWASRRTCERLNCRLADVVAVPPNHPLYLRGDREKCRYWLDI